MAHLNLHCVIDYPFVVARATGAFCVILAAFTSVTLWLVTMVFNGQYGAANQRQLFERLFGL